MARIATPFAEIQLVKKSSFFLSGSLPQRSRFLKSKTHWLIYYQVYFLFSFFPFFSLRIGAPFAWYSPVFSLRRQTLNTLVLYKWMTKAVQFSFHSLVITCTLSHELKSTSDNASSAIYAVKRIRWHEWDAQIWLKKCSVRNQTSSIQRRTCSPTTKRHGTLS